MSLEFFKNSVKLVALSQALLEQMDEVKGTRFYKHSLKNSINRLEKDIEIHIQAPLRSLDQTDEELFTRIQQNIEAIMDMSVDELAAMRIALDDHRKEGEH